MNKNNPSISKLFDPSSGNKAAWIAATLVALVTFAVYLPALQNGFVNWDDNILVYENPYIRSINFKLLGWDITALTEMWVPLTMLSFALDYAVWGLNPKGYHLTNNIFHTLNTILVFILTIRLIGHAKPGKDRLGKEAIIAGSVTSILFGIHPLRVESVVWVTERKDVLYSFFFLLSILAYIKYVSMNSKRINYYAATLVLFIFALMSKLMAVSLPIVLLILDFYPFRRFKIEAGPRNILGVLLEKLPFLLSALLLSILILLPHPSADKILTQESFTERIFLAAHSYIFYLAKILLPFNLAHLYPSLPSLNYLNLEYTASLLLFFAITFFSVWSLKRNKLFAAVWLYYVATLMPVIGINKIATFAAANRYTYLPSLGLFLLVGLGITAIVKECSKRQYQAFIITDLFLILALSGVTIKQIALWKDSITLWSNEIKIFPGVALSYYNRGLGYDSLGAYQEAIRDFSKAIEINHNHSAAYNNRGVDYGVMGNYRQALNDFEKVIEFDPKNVTVYNNRGNVYFGMGEYLKAIENYNKAVEVDPKNPKNYYNLGITYSQIGNMEQALFNYKVATSLGLKEASNPPPPSSSSGYP